MELLQILLIALHTREFQFSDVQTITQLFLEFGFGTKLQFRVGFLHTDNNNNRLMNKYPALQYATIGLEYITNCNAWIPCSDSIISWHSKTSFTCTQNAKNILTLKNINCSNIKLSDVTAFFLIHCTIAKIPRFKYNSTSISRLYS